MSASLTLGPFGGMAIGPHTPVLPFLTFLESIATASALPLYFLETSLNAGPSTFLSMLWQAMQPFFCANSAPVAANAELPPIKSATTPAPAAKTGIRRFFITCFLSKLLCCVLLMPKLFTGLINFRCLITAFSLRVLSCVTSVTNASANSAERDFLPADVFPRSLRCSAEPFSSWLSIYPRVVQKKLIRIKENKIAEAQPAGNEKTIVDLSFRVSLL